MRELERRVLLSVLDRKWREHLYEMDYLREGIGLRAYSQRDPLVEYQREGFDMFAAMMDGIKEESVGFLFNLEVQVEEDEEQDAAEEIPDAAKGLEDPKPEPQLTYSAPSETGDPEAAPIDPAAQLRRPVRDVGRNNLCPCGSGKKYKRCHGAPGGPTGQVSRVG